jgi:hypothetical protein
MDASKKTPPDYQGSDGDVGFLIYKVGHTVKQFFVWIGRGLSILGEALIAFIVFLFRNAIWLLVGTIVGLAFGYYNYAKQGAYYTSEMTIKANFNSTRSLYNTIEYLNSLIAANKTDDLSKVLGITPAEADQLIEFSGNNVESEIITADMYKAQFMQDEHRNPRIRRDTFWLRTIEYSTFKESLTKFDYPYHNIELKSTNPSIFSKTEKGIVNYISRVQLLQDIKNEQIVSNNDEEKALVAAIQSIDTLRHAYSQRLARGESTGAPSANQLTVLQSPATGEMKAPELEVYDKLLDLLDQLKRSRLRNSTENDIIEVISSFNPVGKKLNFFRQNGTRDILTGLILSIIILLFVGSYRKLDEMNKMKRVKNSA